MPDEEINPELVINDLLDRNRELTLQLSVMRSAYKQLQERFELLSLETQSKNKDKVKE